MGEAGPQAAGGTCGREVERALGLLRAAYRAEFTFGHDPERGGFWVTRDGQAGVMLTDPDPEGLGKKLEDTFGGAE